MSYLRIDTTDGVVTKEPEFTTFDAVLLGWRRMVRWFWSYRELIAFYVLIPFAVGMVLSGFIGNAIPLAVVTAATTAAAVFYEPCRHALRDYWRRGRARHDRALFKSGWPNMCVNLGWSKNYGTNVRHPQLLSFELGEDGGHTVELHPLPHQATDQWGTMTDQLRRSVGAAHGTWTESRPGVLQIHLSHHELPTMLQLSDIGAAGGPWDEIELGLRADGERLVWRPSEVPHLLVAGVTQGGKGSVLRLLQVHALGSGWRLFAINPKSSGEFGWLKAHGVPVFGELDSIEEILTIVYTEMLNRQRQLEAANLGSWQQLQGVNWQPVMVTIDEGAALLTINKANKETAQVQQRIGDMLTRLSMMGRAFGIHLVLATQRADVSALGPAGGQLRNNLEARIAVCQLDRDGLTMMFKDTADPEVKHGLDGTKGRALATRLTSGDTDVVNAQVFYISDDDINTTALHVATPQGMPALPAST